MFTLATLATIDLLINYSLDQHCASLTLKQKIPKHGSFLREGAVKLIWTTTTGQGCRSGPCALPPSLPGTAGHTGPRLSHLPYSHPQAGRQGQEFYAHSHINTHNCLPSPQHPLTLPPQGPTALPANGREGWFQFPDQARWNAQKGATRAPCPLGSCFRMGY